MGMTPMTSFAELPDKSLIAAVRTLAGNERQAMARLVASLAEFDSRRLYLGEGCSSLFTYCTQVLRLSEHAAYGRIEAARAARRFPVILGLLAAGAINLTTVGLLARHLTQANHKEVLASATHKAKGKVERLVAGLSPQPDVPSTVRKLPAAALPRVSPHPAAAPVPALADVSEVDSQSKGPASAPRPPRPAVVAPLAPERYKVQLTISRETHDKLRRVQDLMRHANPDGDPAVIFDRALTVLLEQLEKRKLASTALPRPAHASKPRSRHIPSAVKREIWARDGGQCAFRGNLERCAEKGFLEYHHVIPYAEGGEAVATNIELRCRAHNAYESERHFGPRGFMLAREGWPVGGDRLGLDLVDGCAPPHALESTSVCERTKYNKPMSGAR